MCLLCAVYVLFVIAARYRANFPGQPHFAKDHQILRQRTVAQAGDHRQQQRQVGAGFRDLHPADHIDEDVLIGHL